MAISRVEFAEARARRDEGMRHVDENASPDWKAAVTMIIRGFACGHVFLAEVALTYLPDGVAVHDRRALGPVMKRLEKAGYIEKAGVGAAATSNLSLKVRWRRTFKV